MARAVFAVDWNGNMTRLDANDTGRNEEGLGISDNAAVISQFISSPRRHQMELFQQYTRSGMHELNLDMDEFGSTDEESALSVLMTCDSDIGWEELPTIDDLVGDTAVVTFPSHKSKRRKRTYELRKVNTVLLSYASAICSLICSGFETSRSSLTM